MLRDISAKLHIITSSSKYRVPRVEPHTSPQTGDPTEGIQSRDQLLVPEKLPETPFPMRTQSAPPPPFKAQILLEVVLTDLAVDLTIIRLLCVGIFLGQARSQVRSTSVQGIGQSCNYSTDLPPTNPTLTLSPPGYGVVGAGIRLGNRPEKSAPNTRPADIFPVAAPRPPNALQQHRGMVDQ